MPVKEQRQLAKSFRGFRNGMIEKLRVALPLEHLQLRFHASLPELAVRPHGVAEE